MTAARIVGAHLPQGRAARSRAGAREPSGMTERNGGVLLAALVLLSGTAVAPTPPPALKFVPGTYRQIDTVTKQPLPIGNQVVIIAGKAGRLAFSLNAVRQTDTNQGFAVGILPPALPGTWTRTSASGNCKLLFEGVPHGLKITQDAGFGDCGFGAGVTANGTYQLVAQAPLKT
jgi:hypothetical protein